MNDCLQKKKVIKRFALFWAIQLHSYLCVRINIMHRYRAILKCCGWKKIVYYNEKCIKNYTHTHISLVTKLIKCIMFSVEILRFFICIKNFSTVVHSTHLHCNGKSYRFCNSNRSFVGNSSFFPKTHFRRPTV